MLTGRRAFDGETISDTIAAVLVARAGLERACRPGRPRGVRRLLRRCLREDVNRGLRDIGDARLELEEIASSHADVAAVAGARPRASRRSGVGYPVVASAAAGSDGEWGATGAPPAAPVRRSGCELSLPAGLELFRPRRAPLSHLA